MPAFTVQQLIDRAAAIADMHDSFVTPAQWLAWYNTEARALELFIARSGWVTNLASSVDAGASYTATITGAPLAILGVYEVRDGRYRPLKLQNQVDFTRQNVAAATDTGDAHWYAIVTSNSTDDTVVHFYPQPTTGTYRVLYLAGRTPATAVTDSATWSLGWEERIVLGMARRALIKEESDPRKVEQLMGEQDAVIEEFCWNRSLGSVPQVRNVDRVARGWSDEMSFGTYESWYWL